MTKNASLHLLDVVVIWLLSASIIALATLGLGHFSPLGALLSSVLVTTLTIIFLVKGSPGGNRLTSTGHVVPLLLLLFIASIFRYEPFAWIAGGQDQGVYTNMSKHFQDQGKIFVTDELRESLPDEFRQMYDSTNYSVDSNPATRVENEKEGNYLPGVYLKDQERSQTVFQFYHLHPLWMAMFSEVLGRDKHSYSLVFFSMLSILAFYLLAYELTKSKQLAFMAGVLLALNPLHAFFSKFPVTEVVALAFSTLSFYYLLRYYNGAKRGVYSSLFLIFSALCLGGLFFTRISGFMYMPFFFLLLLVVEIYAQDTLLRRQLRSYIFGVFILYGLSVLYGLLFSYPYASDIYRLSFSRALGSNWEQKLSSLLIVFSTFYLLSTYLSRKPYMAKVWLQLPRLTAFFPYIFLTIFLLSTYKLYQLGFTSDLASDPGYGARWNAAGSGTRAFLYWSPFVLVEYLSPFIAALFVFAVSTSRKIMTVERTLLLFFILFFFAYICLLQWFIPYQYYYARYLLSEALPYILLFSVTSITTLPRGKKVAYILVACAAAYSLLITATQWRGKDMDGMKKSLDKLTEYVAPEAALILGPGWLYSAAHSELKTPLNFYYNYNVVSTDKTNLNQFISYFCRGNASQVHFLSAGDQPGLGRPITKLVVKAEIFEKTTYIPIKLVEDSVEYNLFRIDCPRWRRSWPDG